MKINKVEILNWENPGDKWWNNVQAKPSEPLIEASMKMTLSWDEYHAMLEKDRMERDSKPVREGGEG